MDPVRASQAHLVIENNPLQSSINAKIPTMRQFLDAYAKKRAGCYGSTVSPNFVCPGDYSRQVFTWVRARTFKICAQNNRIQFSAILSRCLISNKAAQYFRYHSSVVNLRKVSRDDLLKIGPLVWAELTSFQAVLHRCKEVKVTEWHIRTVRGHKQH